MTNSDHRIDALPQGHQLHAYRIERLLGSGAFGITYLAEHQMLETWHVIKEYLPDCGAREQNRSTVSPRSASDKDLFDWGLKSFYEEARLLHKISHPHIIKVTDMFEANSTAYFVMPYLRGITLHEWMKQHPSPSQSELEAIFVPLIEGLKYIHAKGLLHRDIKPENIYILESSHPILIDFGSARIAIGQKSKALTQVLTPGFAPWEQYRTKGNFTPALDLYSLAACMYMAITGVMPEEAPGRIEEDVQPRLAGSEYERHYNSSFLQAIDKSLNVYAKDRHQDGFSFQQDLVGLSHVMLEEHEVLDQQVHQKIDHVSTDANAPAGTNEQTPDYHPAHYKESGERKRKIGLVGWAVLAVSVSIMALSGVYWLKDIDFKTVEHAPTSQQDTDSLQQKPAIQNLPDAQVAPERWQIDDPANVVNGISIEVGYIKPTSIGSTFLRWKVNNKTEKMIEFSINSYGVFDGMQYSDSRGTYKVLPRSSTQDPLFSIDIENHELIFESGTVLFYIEFKDRTRQIEGTAEMKFSGNELRRYLVDR